MPQEIQDPRAKINCLFVRDILYSTDVPPIRRPQYIDLLNNIELFLSNILATASRSNCIWVDVNLRNEIGRQTSKNSKLWLAIYFWVFCIVAMSVRECKCTYYSRALTALNVHYHREI